MLPFAKYWRNTYHVLDLNVIDLNIQNLVKLKYKSYKKYKNYNRSDNDIHDSGSESELQEPQSKATNEKDPLSSQNDFKITVKIQIINISIYKLNIVMISTYKKEK